MKNYILILCLFNLLLVVGCRQKKEIEITQDNFPEFRKLKLTKVYIMTIGRGYGYEYYIEDLKKADVIRVCIYNAKQTEYDNELFQKDKQTRKNENEEILYFETKDSIYTMRFAWNDEFVYGFWWESPELLKVFEKWQLFEELSKADPAWPKFIPKYPLDKDEFKPPSYEGNEPQQSIEPNEGGLIF